MEPPSSIRTTGLTFCFSLTTSTRNFLTLIQEQEVGKNVWENTVVGEKTSTTTIKQLGHAIKSHPHAGFPLRRQLGNADVTTSQTQNWTMRPKFSFSKAKGGAVNDLSGAISEGARNFMYLFINFPPTEKTREAHRAQLATLARQANTPP